MATLTEKAVIDLVINGRQSEATMKQITSATNNARKALYQLAETDPGYAKQKKQLEELMDAQSRRIVKINQEKTAWEKFKAGGMGMVSSIAGGNLVATGIQKLLELGPAVIDHQMKLRDSFADIAKAADMSDKEVADLNAQLKGLDTRTATEDLRNMAVVGGQFGIAKAEMAGFVESADKLNVALGDQFESVEKVAETALTLRNTFQDIKSDKIDEDMMKIGNGLNYLEAQGAATAPVMADFSSRIGGVAIPLGLTSGQVLGLSATLQELNVTAERGSSAMVDILSGITKAPETFAKYARGVDGATLSSKQFKDLVNSDLNAAFMAVIRGFKEGDTSATGMAAKLADMDIKGNGVMEIFMKLASNTDLLTQRQKQSAEALSNTSSITAEFSKKNHELSVNLKILGEWFDGFLENGVLTRMAEGIVSLTVKVLGLSTASSQVSKNYLDQRNRAAELSEKMGPLIERHEKLSQKSKLSATEQEELKKLTAQIAAAMPAAVTQFDQYANAIGVSTTKAHELIDAQRQLATQMKASAMEEQKTQLRSIEWQRQQIINKIKSGENVTVDRNGNTTAMPLSPADIQQLQGDLVKLQSQTFETIRTMRDLEGQQSVADRRKARRAAEPKPTPKVDPNAGTMETDAEKKAREKKEKEAARLAKKSATATQRHENELTRLMAEARQESMAGEESDYEKQVAAFASKYTRMYALAKNDQAKIDEIQEMSLIRFAQIDKKRQDKLDEEARKQAEKDNKLGFDAALKAADQTRSDSQAGIDAGVTGKKTGEAEARMLALQADQVYLQQKLLLEQTFAQESADTQRQLTDNWNEQVRLRAQTERDYAEQMKAAEWSLQDAKRSAMATGVDVLKGFLKEGTIAYKAAIVAQKAFAIAQVIVDMNREVAQIFANPAWSLLPDGGLALKTASATAAKVRAGISIASIAATGIGELAQKDDGGFTGIRDLYGSASGYYDQPTRVNAGARSYIVGEKRKEWIMGGEMLQNPVMANLAGALQALQVTGAYKQLSFGSNSSTGNSAGSSSSGSGSNDGLMLAILQELQQSRAAVQASSKRPVVMNYRLFKEFEDQIDQIKQENSL